MEKINLTEYAHLLGDNCDAPELDKRTILDYLELKREFKLEESDTIYLFKDKLAFSVDEEGKIQFPLTECVSYHTLPCSASSFLEQMPTVLRELEPVCPKGELIFEPDAFQLNVDEKELSKFTRIHSPVVDIKDTFENYLSSLTSKRRYKVKQALKESKELLISESDILTTEELNFFVDNTLTKWEGDRTPLAQMLWSIAYSGDKYFFKIKKGSKLESVSSFNKVKDSLYFQSFSKDEKEPLSNVGAILLSNVVQWLHSSRVTSELNPFCMSLPAEFEDVDVYKRILINKDKQFLSMFGIIDAGDSTPPLLSLSHGWLCKENSFLGKPL